MKKATRKILSLALVVMMLLGTFAMMFAYAAEEPVTTPKAYADAEDKEKLLDVNFSDATHFTPIDDTALAYDNNGVTYTDTGLACPTDPALNADGNGDGDTKDMYNSDPVAFLSGWRKNLTDEAVVIEENGAALKIDGAYDAVGTEGEAGYVAAIPSEAKTTDQRFIGQITAYDLAEKTYTYELEYFRKGIARSKIYFGNGMFLNFGGSDQHMPCLGIELNASGYRLMRQSSAITTNVMGKPNYATNAAGETVTNLKVVLTGSAVQENVTLWTGSWLTTPDKEDPANTTAHWTGDAIIVNYSIYNTITKEDGTVQDIRCSTGSFVQPADIELVFGIGEYNNPGKAQYYGARNLAIYKGDTSVPFTFEFTQVYGEAGWGSELTQFDAKGITNAAFNYTNGYEWVHQNDVTVDAEGVVTINNETTARTQGAYTPHPFGDEWNQGYYEMELTVNNASRLKIGLLEFADQTRVGFNILPNVANADLTTGSKTAYLHADAGNAATLWTSAANSFGTGIVEKSTAALAAYMETIVYDTYVADDASDEDTDPQDPRNVRDYGGNRANIKIVYNCVDYIVTLFEKVDNEWLPTAAIDYSKAVEQGTILGACLDFQAYNAKTNATIKNIRTMKGSSVVHQTEWTIGDFTQFSFGYDADFQAQITEDFVEFYGLWNHEFGWTNDGATVVEDFEALYNELDDSNYGPQAINLAPIVKYEAATEAVLRGLRVDADDEKGTYDVDFVVALDAIEDIAAVGYDIVKTVDFGGYTKTTTVNVETTEVFASINANGLKLDAAAALGAGQYTEVEGEGEDATTITYGYVAAFGLEDEAVVEGAVVTYAVTVYTVALDGTKTAANETVTYTFVEGEYMPSLWY